MIFRNPLEVTEDFVNQFNAATTIDEKEDLENVAQKMLERIKVINRYKC